jgi:choice-of-anchor B domain-containing protein
MTDVWGYVDASTGREYALVGTRVGTEGFFIVDVTSPQSPTQISQANFSIGFDVKVHGHYAYTVTGSGGAGGAVIDLTNVFLPIRVPIGLNSSHNIFIDDRGFLYLAAAGGQRDLWIYDLNPNPENPGVPIWNDGIGNDHDVSVVDTILYDFHGPNGTRIYGVSNPASPVLLGVISDPNIRFHHSGYPTEDGKYLFICDELALHPTADITVWNIENPASPFKVTEIADAGATVHNLYIVGDFAYTSYYTSGFKVYDVSDPTQPVLADSFDTSAFSGEGFAGAFGVYPFTASGIVYVSDMENGLYVFSFTPDVSAVTFAAFDAAYRMGSVRLSWAIGSADDLEGFHVYRSPRAEDGYRRLNPAMIHAAAAVWDDRSAKPGETYWYRVGAVDSDGEFLSIPRRVTIPERSLTLWQNVPNPFNPATSITYELPAPGHVVLTVYNTLGQRVRTLVDRFERAGVRTITWTGRGDNGGGVSSGVYFYRVEVDGISQTRRMLLLK